MEERKARPRHDPIISGMHRQQPQLTFQLPPLPEHPSLGRNGIPEGIDPIKPPNPSPALPKPPAPGQGARWASDTRKPECDHRDTPGTHLSNLGAGPDPQPAPGDGHSSTPAPLSGLDPQILSPAALGRTGASLSPFPMAHSPAESPTPESLSSAPRAAAVYEPPQLPHAH